MTRLQALSQENYTKKHILINDLVSIGNVYMKKTAISTLILITLLTLGIVCVQPIKAQYKGNITINADGSINPSTAPILQTSLIYSSVSDVEGSITVHTSNVILDGNGHTVSGISLQETINVTVKNFIVASQGERIGILLSGASNSLIVNNTITGFESIQALNGLLFAGIHVKGGNSNTIIQNKLMHNLYQMDFINTANNVIVQNNITSNTIWNFHGPYSIGICFGSASNNIIYHNNFVNSTYLAKVSNSENIWDNGFPDGGNYWSDYQTKYPNASVIENSGIGNTPYYIVEQNKDNYPLMEPFKATPTAETSPTPTSSSVSAPVDFPPITAAIVLALSVLLIVAGLVIYNQKRHR